MADDYSLQTSFRKYWGNEILESPPFNILLRWYNSTQIEIEATGLPPWFLPVILTFTILFPVTFLIWCCFSRATRVVRKSSERVKAAKEFIAPSEGPRFRKRDKIAFMGRRVIRNAKAVGNIIKGGQGRKRKAVAKLVRRIVGEKGTPPTGSRDYVRQESHLPAEYFEEDEGGESNLPLALLLVLKNMRVFGQFDNKIFVELMKSIEYITLRPNAYLFRVGDPDENMYIVESGRINVYSCPSGIQAGELEVNAQQLLKQIGKGEAILSLLSFLESMGGKDETFKTISAKATEDTKVIKFAFKAFKSAFEKYPEDLTKVVQVVMIRLQRVTLLALHQYLGLGAELLTQEHRGSKSRSRRASTFTKESGDSSSMNITATSPPVFVNQSIPAAICASPHFKTPTKLFEMDYNQLQKVAIEVFLELLDLTEEDLTNPELDGVNIADFVNVASWEDGDILVEEEMDDEANLLVILQGAVVLTQASPEDDDDLSNPSQVEIHRAYPGGVLGQLQCLTGEPSFFTIKAIDEAQNLHTKVASLDVRFIQRCMKLYPKVALKLARSCVDQLSPYVRSIDFALEWLQLESGRALYKQGQVADSTYVVLSGRLRSVIKKGEKRELVNEYARGDLTGIVETLMRTPRSTTVIAVRDTEVAKIPAGLIDAIKIRYPVVMLRLIKLLGQKVQQSWERGSPGSSLGPPGVPSSLDPHGSNVTRMGIAQSNFSTVAILAISPDVPVSSFAFELLHALTQIDPAIRLTKEYVLEELGASAFDKANDFRLSEWLASQEDKNRIVLYQCDPELTEWTRLCIRHADVIFILTNQKGNPTLSQFERSLEDLSRRTRKEMIFLHHEDTKYPKGTANWLRDRGWINTHYHVKCPRRMYSKRTKYSKIMQGPPPDVNSDFSRLARAVTGQTVGLVLGGGGARGCSHIGIIKAILEAGIPIDTVAGVSIGSFIGGLYAREKDITEVTVKAREFSNKISQVWRWVLDFCYPYTSYFNGFNFNLVLESALGSDSDILDNWLPFFTVTTDITQSCQRIHDYGSLWRYVRASMSLAGWLPPICDPHDGHLLLDGGYANNLPADIMRQRGAKHIMAVDVGAEDNTNFSEYGDTLSGWHILLSKFNPWSKPINVPNQAEVQLRLAYVSCVDKLEAVKNSGYCEYIRPPIEKYGTLQFQVRIEKLYTTFL